MQGALLGLATRLKSRTCCGADPAQGIPPAPVSSACRHHQGLFVPHALVQFHQLDRQTQRSAPVPQGLLPGVALAPSLPSRKQGPLQHIMKSDSR